MLVNELPVYEHRIIAIMSDLALITSMARAGLMEIAKQSHALGIGLQNAAPGDKTGKPNPSIEYLLEISKELNQYVQECSALMPPDK